MKKAHTQGSLTGGRHTVLEYLRRAPETIEVLLIEDRKAGKELREVVDGCQAASVRYQFVPRSKLEKLPVKQHQGYVLRLFHQGFLQGGELCEQAVQRELPLILVLDQIQDEGNLGTLARSLFALGGAGLVLPKNRSAPLGQVARQASAGALSELPVARETNLARFLRQSRDRGFFSCYTGTSAACGSIFETELSWPLLLVLGNEEKGVRPNVAKACDLGVTIPLSRGFDSLNVAQAGAMLMMELLRRRLASAACG